MFLVKRTALVPTIGVALTAVLVAACGAHAAHGGPSQPVAAGSSDETDASAAGPVSGAPVDVAAVRTAVTEQIARTKTCKDQNNRLLPDCFPVPIGWRRSDFVYPADAPVVLHIEPGVTKLLTLGKYRHRVKAILDQDATGAFVSRDAIGSDKTVSSGFRRIVTELIAPTTGFVSATALRDLGPRFEQVFAAENDDIGEGLVGGHALMTLGIIGEYAPNAAFVVATMQEHLPADALCAKDFAALETYESRARSTLTAQIRALGVQFINMSGGDDRASVAAAVHGLCPDLHYTDAETVRLLGILRGFYETLGTLDDVVLVQAAGAFPDRSDATSDADPIDCPETNFPHRIRVGSIDLAHSDIPPGGAALIDYAENVPRSLRGGARCIDLYVNSQTAQGVVGEHPIEVTVNGVGSYPLPFMYTSFAAPIATARLVNLRTTTSDLPPTALYELLTDCGQRTVQDPLLHRQFEVYRLGLRSD